MRVLGPIDANAVLELRTAPPLLLALPLLQDEPLLADALNALRRIDDASAAEPLRAFAATLPAKQRSRKSVLAVAKHLARERKEADLARFAETAAVGSDGGPVLVLDAEAADAWPGVPRDYATTTADNAYDRACAAVDSGRAGFVAAGGARALVLPGQHAGF